MSPPQIRYYVVFEYVGSRFHGWQRQPGLRTVQGEIERALSVALHGLEVNVLASGRTDSGVHAKAQAATFLVPAGTDMLRIAHAISSMLKNEVSVRGFREVPAHFHILNNAVRKQYSYILYTDPMPPVLDHGRVWHLTSRLDEKAMVNAAQEFLGAHNFLSFCGAGSFSKTFEREIFECEVTRDGPYLRFRIVGSGFLKQMVRNMVGTLVDIGRARLSLGVSEILSRQNRRCAGVTAQPYGLSLDWVEHEINGERIRSNEIRLV